MDGSELGLSHRYSGPSAADSGAMKSDFTKATRLKQWNTFAPQSRTLI
jgi:hypothetical protein